MTEREIYAVKKTYRIEVDCANCDNLMETAARKTEGVVVNFMTQKMTVEFAEGSDPKTVMQSVRKACRKVEPDCEIEL